MHSVCIIWGVFFSGDCLKNYFIYIVMIIVTCNLFLNIKIIKSLKFALFNLEYIFARGNFSTSCIILRFVVVL